MLLLNPYSLFMISQFHFYSPIALNFKNLLFDKNNQNPFQNHWNLCKKGQYCHVNGSKIFMTGQKKWSILSGRKCQDNVFFAIWQEVASFLPCCVGGGTIHVLFVLDINHNHFAF